MCTVTSFLLFGFWDFHRFTHLRIRFRRDTDDEELSEDDVNDPALLRELEGLSGGGGDESHAPSSRGGHGQQTAAEPLVYASANLTAVIDERIANYTQVRFSAGLPV